MKLPDTVLGHTVKTFLYTLLAAILCFFLNLSITMAISIAGTQRLGVRAGGALADGRTLVVEDRYATDTAPAHRLAYILDKEGNREILIDRDKDGENEETLDKADKELLASYTTERNYTENIRTDIPEGLQRLSNWLIQILCVILFLAFPYSHLWYTGAHDRNAVQFGHMAEDKLRGLKVGALASIPAALMWLLLAVGKLSGGLAGFVKIYRWFNVCFWPYMKIFIPAEVMDPAAVSWGGVAGMLPVLISLPAIAWLGYLLGYSEFSLRDKLVYAATGKKPKRRKRK